MSANLQNVKVGTVTGTGAALTVTLGYRPDHVRVVNITDGDTVHEFFTGMTAGHAIKITNGDTTQMSRITSNGITLTDTGFTLGTDVSESDKLLGYVATRSY
jgi:hypothetical protein